MSYVVNIPKKEADTRIEVPFDIPTVLIQQGAVELFAAKVCGWTPESEETAVNAIAGYLRGQVKEQYRVLLLELAATQAREQMQQQYEAMFK